MSLKVSDLLEKLKDADPDTEVILLTAWGYPMLLEQIDVTKTDVLLSGRTPFEGPGMGYV